MPFPLSDLKRSYGRSGVAGGPPDVRPYLLAGRELAAQRRRLLLVIDWHARGVGRPRQALDFDELAQLVGDYRLARCLGACLQTSFRFVPQSFEDAVAGAAPAGARQQLAESGARGPTDLRLRVFETVGAEHGGFVTVEQRPAVLAGVAAGLGLEPEALETLLWLDAEGNHRLDAVAPLPTPEALAAAYNRRALATLLVRSMSADLILPAPDGATIRRLYLMVKRHGLLCDLQLVEPARGAAGGVHVHLFGPLEVFGPRTRHGDRFAGVLLGLLYRFPALQGSARVLLNEREYRLGLGPDVAVALGGEDPLHLAVAEAGALAASSEGDVAPEGPAGAPLDEHSAGAVAASGGLSASAGPTALVARPEGGESFDSDVEAQLFATLRGMERGGDAAGWTVEREPEPLIHGTTVMVPDFALSRPPARGRPGRRVYVEVIGFWTAAYRERKRDKLRQLAGQADLLLIIQEALASHFQGLPFPILTYKHRVPAGDLIRLLNRLYVHSPEDAVDMAVVRRELDTLLEAVDPALGLLLAEELRRALELPTAASLSAVVQRSPGSADGAGASSGAPGPVGGWRWLPGVGMYHRRWLDDLRACCAATFDTGDGNVSLETLREAVRASGLAAAEWAAAHLEALLPAAGYEVDRQSLFEATVRRLNAPPA